MGTIYNKLDEQLATLEELDDEKDRIMGAIYTLRDLVRQEGDLSESEYDDLFQRLFVMFGTDNGRIDNG